MEADFSPDGALALAGKGPPSQSRWLQRTLSSVGTQLGQVRDKLFALAGVERHDLVLDLNAGTGLITWEAVRRAPVGGVWALAANQQTADALKQQANNLEALERPVILIGSLTDLPELISAALVGQDVTQRVSYNVIIGRNALTQLADKAATAQVIADLLKPEGRLALAEIVPRHTQRLHQLVDLSGLPAELVARAIAAEEAIYADPADPMVNWDTPDLRAVLQSAGLTRVEITGEILTSDLFIGPDQIERWWLINKP
jgi:putative ATPase